MKQKTLKKERSCRTKESDNGSISLSPEDADHFARFVYSRWLKVR